MRIQMALIFCLLGLLTCDAPNVYVESKSPREMYIKALSYRYRGDDSAAFLMLKRVFDTFPDPAYIQKIALFQMQREIDPVSLLILERVIMNHDLEVQAQISQKVRFIAKQMEKLLKKTDLKILTPWFPGEETFKCGFEDPPPSIYAYRVAPLVVQLNTRSLQFKIEADKHRIAVVARLDRMCTADYEYFRLQGKIKRDARNPGAIIWEQALIRQKEGASGW